jgi:Rab GDP dissociation inhibitor
MTCGVGRNLASLQLKQFYHKFRGDAAVPDEAKLGKQRDYCVDLIPKFIMASGKLVQVLVHTKVSEYMELKLVGGAYVYRQGKVAQVPTTAPEAMQSPLMSVMEKTRAVQVSLVTSSVRLGETCVLTIIER